MSNKTKNTITQGNVNSRLFPENSYAGLTTAERYNKAAAIFNKSALGGQYGKLMSEIDALKGYNASIDNMSERIAREARRRWYVC